MKTKTKSLERVIARMLTENVSRNGENKGKNVAYWRAQPEVDLKFKIFERNSKERGYVDPTISVFHFLNKCLDNYDKKLTRQLWSFAETVENRGDDGQELFENWLDEIEADNGKFNRVFRDTSCDGQDYLSKNLQYLDFKLNGDDFIILQINNGSNFVGEYSRPRIFALSRYPDKNIWDSNCFSIADGENYWDYDFDAFKSAGDYISGKESSFDFLKDCPFTSDEKEKGRGKIYVDKEGNGYSPINGNKLKGYI